MNWLLKNRKSNNNPNPLDIKTQTIETDIGDYNLFFDERGKLLYGEHDYKTDPKLKGIDLELKKLVGIKMSKMIL